MKEDIKAIILSAGKSGRLRPLTGELPKCLLQISKKRIIDYQIQPLLKNNINQIIVVVGFQKDKIINYLNSAYPTASFSFIVNPIFDKTNAAYSFWLAKKELDSDFLYFNSDLVFDPIILKDLLLDKRKNLIPIQKNPWDEEAVKVVTKENLQITEIGKKIEPAVSWGEFVGTAKFNRDFAQNLFMTIKEMMQKKEYKKFFVDAVNNVIKVHESKVFGLDITNLPAIEIDFPEDLERAREFIAPKIDKKS